MGKFLASLVGVAALACAGSAQALTYVYDHPTHAKSVVVSGVIGEPAVGGPDDFYFLYDMVADLHRRGDYEVFVWSGVEILDGSFTFDRRYDDGNHSRISVIPFDEPSVTRHPTSARQVNGSGDYLTVALDVDFAPGSEGQPFFIRVSAIPEPSTWAMMILGIGLAGASLRRRQGKTINA